MFDPALDILFDNEHIGKQDVPKKIIVPLAFGASATFGPTIAPNRVIAERALELSEGKYKIFAQIDVALVDINTVIVTNGKNVFDYISTLQIAEYVFRYCVTNHLISEETLDPKCLPIAHLVVAPPHEARAIRDFQKTGFAVEIDSELAKKYPPDFWFDKNSTQRWTRHPLLWWSREIILRVLPWVLYKKIAG